MLLSLLVAGAAASSVSSCSLPFEVVQDEASARAIAQVVIGSAPPQAVPKYSKRYDLRVSFVPERRSWIPVQHPVPVDNGLSILGGGGLGMEIAACDGAVSGIDRQH